MIDPLLCTQLYPISVLKISIFFEITPGPALKIALLLLLPGPCNINKILPPPPTPP